MGLAEHSPLLSLQSLEARTWDDFLVYGFNVQTGALYVGVPGEASGRLIEAGEEVTFTPTIGVSAIAYVVPEAERHPGGHDNGSYVTNTEMGATFFLARGTPEEPNPEYEGVLGKGVQPR